MEKTYSDLGITDEDFQDKEGNPIEGVNSDGIIDADEAENIIRHLEADETEMKKVMADYYTKYIKDTSGTKPISEDAKSKINESYGYTNQQARDNQQKLKDEGYDIEVDGAWGTKSEEAWTDYTTKKGIDFNETNNPAVNEDGVYDPDADISEVNSVDQAPEEVQEAYIKENQSAGTSLFNPRNFQIWYRNWLKKNK